jgi:hypothetical protein
MKNKMSLVGMLVVVLTLGVVFTSCENEPQEVKIVQTKANAVSKVTATKLTTSTGSGSYITYTHTVSLTWDAASDVSGYTVYYQEQGKKTIQEITSSNSLTLNTVGGDIDKRIATYTISSSLPSLGKSYRFGVRTSPLSSSINTTYSDIVWSDYIPL